MGILDDLAAKHAGAPPATGGILDQLAAQHGGTPAPAAPTGPRKTASDFLADEGTVGTRVRNWGKAKGQSMAQQPPTLEQGRKAVASAVRPVLEGGGAVLGGILGTPAGPAGTVGGGVLGYAIGSQATDLIQGPSATMVKQPVNLNVLENPKYRPRTIGEEIGSATNKLVTGAMFEMGGQGAALVGGKVIQGGKNLIERGAPFSPTRNRINAADQFGDAATGAQGNWKTTDPGFAERGVATDNNRLTQVKQATRNRDDALFNRLNSTLPEGQRPLQPSAGQREGGKLLALEQKQRLKYKTRGTTPEAMPFDERVALNSAVNADAALTRVTKQVGRGEALPASEYASTTGERIVKSVQESEAAVKPEVKRLFNQPEFGYEMPRVEYDEALESVLGSNLDETARAAVQGVAKFAEGAEKTAAGLKSIKETIDGRLSQAIRQGDNAAVAALQRVKQGVWDSFETMGKAAEAGDVAVHEGRIVYPSKLRSQIATLDERIAAESAKPDLAAMRADMGTQPGMMKVTGESDTAYQARLTQAYEKAGKPVPMGTADVTDLTARRAALQDTLDAAKPAEDVAASYASARRYTKEEQKDRFARDTIAGILKKGDQYGGLNTPLEQIPDKVFTPRGAHELVRAKMPFRAADEAADPAARLAAGKQAAGELVYPHVVTKFTKAAIDPNTGVMSIPAAERFLRDNGEVLNTLGLTKDVEQIIKGQLPKAVKAHLDGLGVDVMKNPTMSARMAVKFARKQFGPSIGKYFGSTRAVMDWAHTLEIAERSNVVATLRGSNTAEKLDLLALGDKVSMFGTVLAKAGWLMNSIKGAVGAVVKNPMKGAEAQVDQFIQDALLDGKAAEALLQIYRAKRVSDISQRAADALRPYFLNQKMPSNTAVGRAVGIVKNAAVQASPVGMKPFATQAAMTETGKELGKFAGDVVTGVVTAPFGGSR